MDPQLCYEQLQAHAWQTAGPALHQPNEAERIAVAFAERATQSLDRREWQQLLEFLDRPRERHDQERYEQELATQIHNTVQQFHKIEIETSQQSPERLGQPDGCFTADLALILHLQTRDVHSNKILDDHSDNVTLDLLYNKGVNMRSTFGMDWHWRSETTQDFRDRTHCPFQKWGAKLRKLHDEFSWQLLETIPARFIVTGSACARLAIQKRLPSAKQLEIGDLTFDLDFRFDKLYRIILHLPHPTAGFFSGKSERDGQANRLDNGWNFMLWLTGNDFVPDTFRREYAQHSSNSLAGHSMLRKSYAYRRDESVRKSKLCLNEYPLEYRTWAERRLHCPAASIIEAGNSLVEAVLAPIHQKQSESHLRKNAAKKCTTTPFETIHGKPVHIVPHGDVQVQRSGSQPPLRFRVYKDVAARILEQKGTPRVHLTPDQVQLSVNGHVCYTRPYQQLIQSPNWGEAWAHQLEREAQLLSGSLLQEKCFKRTTLEDTPFPGYALYSDEYLLKGKFCYYSCIRLNFNSAVPNSSAQLRLEIVDAGCEHPHMICPTTPKGDPGCRLGIWASYNTTQGIVKGWQKMRGTSNIAKINTLVDTEDGRTREWISSKPRRYLKAFRGTAHWYSSTKDN